MTETSLEFAARRRTTQDEAIAALLPFARAYVEDPTDLEALADLSEAVTELYVSTYLADGGDRLARTAAFLTSLSRSLAKTTPESDPNLTATWLAVATTNAASLQAGTDDPRPILLKWTTMHDQNVREAHADADRQRRPAGALFHVGGENLRYPGDPRGSLSNTMNCRCVLQPVPFYGPEAASLAAAAAKETDMPLEAPLAWHGVLAPEGAWSGDGRRFALDSLRNRDLPLPLTWQRAASEGHDGSTVVARIDTIERVQNEAGINLMQAEGVWIDTPETDEIVGLVAEFGRFGVSIDADDSEFEFDEEGQRVTFTSARIASASLVSIPAFAEAWIALGTWADEAAAFPPKSEDDMMPGGGSDDEDDPEEECDPDSPDYEDCLARKAQDKGGDDERWEKVDPEPGHDANTIAASQGTSGGVVEMISDAAWDGSAGRFSPEQWKASCILHVCTGDEKSCHKLPIKEPGGALSRAGVHAAASRFGQVDAPPEAKASAARQLRGAYKSLGEEPPDAIKASIEVAETFGRGPGWVTNPEDTRRIWAYWTQPGHEGYAKIGWGAPGDFNRCRALVGEKIAENSPEDTRFLNQICAQWHYDATGFWPGRAPTEQSLEAPKGEPAPAVSLVASGGIKAPAAWFKNPQLSEVTHLQVTEEGRVFGHIAEWSSCHIGYEDVCVAPPPSGSDYAYYASKRVLLDDGSMAATGVISLGGGHANGHLGFTAAIEHYDRTSSAVADIAVGDDEHGIWAAGWMRPGTSEKDVYDLRASDISGDWREVRPGQMELVAALAVNVAGFPTVGVQNRAQVALVAAGVVQRSEPPMTLLMREVVAVLGRREKMAALRNRVGTNSGGQ